MKPVRLALVAILLVVLTGGAGSQVQADDEAGVDLRVTIGLVITDVSVSDIGYNVATISWKTSDDASSQVFYDIESRTKVEDYTYRTDEEPTPVIEHTVNLTGLASRTTYHFRVRSAVDGVEAVSPDYAFTTRTSGGGGGGGGGGPRVYYLEVNLWEEMFTVPITTDGKVQEDLEALSTDGLVTIRITEGIVALTEDGKRLKEIEVWPLEQFPPLPENSYIIGITYDFTPGDATFDPPIEVEMHYDPSHIPGDIDEQKLALAFYDEATGKWVELDSVVDTVGNTVTALVSHFTIFAIIGAITPPPPPPPPAPAAFSVGSLDILPDKVEIGESITISVLVTNAGGQAGSYEVILKIDGVMEGSREITLNAGVSASVMFSVSKDAAGTYPVDVNGLGGSFTVREKPAPAKPANWPLIGGIVAGVIVVGLGVFFWTRRRPSRVFK